MENTTLLIGGQVLGALLGALYSVWSEIAYLRAMRDGALDKAEAAHLLVIARGLRYGMTLFLLASLGLVVDAYLTHASTPPALTHSYWTMIALCLTIITVARSLVRHRVSFALGSATLFTAWWFLVYLSFGWLTLSFGSAVMSFIIAGAIFYALLSYARILASAK